jgi:hypothetical protein
MQLLKRQIVGRPYLSEGISSGDHFEVGAFFAFIGFVVVIGAWFASAGPMVRTFTNFLGITRYSASTVAGLVTPTMALTPINSVNPFLVKTPESVVVNVKIVAPTQEKQAILPTYTPYPTYTPNSSNSQQITATIVPYKIPPAGTWKKYKKTASFTYVSLKVSYYWPPFMGINCRDGDQCDTMADGESWGSYVGQAAACSSDFDFGDVFIIDGGAWVCKDRGGEIVKNSDGSYWIDLLYPYMPIKRAWGSVVNAIYIPKQ